MSECDVDNIIDQLLGVRGARPGRQVNLTENEIKWLCTKGRELFQSQPVLLELEAPIKVSGQMWLAVWRALTFWSKSLASQVGDSQPSQPRQSGVPV